MNFNNSVATTRISALHKSPELRLICSMNSENDICLSRMMHRTEYWAIDRDVFPRIVDAHKVSVKCIAIWRGGESLFIDGDHTAGAK